MDEGSAEYFEYSKAANPVGRQTSKVPYADFPSRLHEEGPTRIVPFDLSDQLHCQGPATSPALCATTSSTAGPAATRWSARTSTRTATSSTPSGPSGRPARRS